VDRDLRASLVAACAAAALSALIGIIAGIGLLVLVLRAVVGGGFIGAAVYGGIVLVKKYLPGLLDAEGSAGLESSSEPAAVPEMGANVDIVLPGDSTLPGMSEGSAEPPGQGRAASSPGSVEEEAIDEPSLLEPEDEASATALPAEAGRNGGARSGSGLDELDVLPDLDGFSDSFTASEFASGGSPSERQDGRPAAMPSSIAAASASVPRTAQGNLDSVALAQAVRTILKRDQKG
jgi:hypothetical protein